MSQENTMRPTCSPARTIGRASNGQRFLARALQTPNSEGKLMRKPWIRALAGFAAFVLPALVCLLGVRLDRLSIGHHPAYEPWIPVGLCSAVLVAAVVP